MNVAPNMIVEEQMTEPANFASRHIGPTASEREEMARVIGCRDYADFLKRSVPAAIRTTTTVTVRPFPTALSEVEAIARLRSLASQNQIYRSYIGVGYYGTLTPAVIQRNILENPGWYTQYTPYQPEISQGRLEALLNFQTLVSELTGLPIANASLLDEATAAAEAMAMSHAVRSKDGAGADTYFIDHAAHPQNIALVKTRAEALGLTVTVGDAAKVSLGKEYFGAFVQYPDTFGAVRDYQQFIAAARALGVVVTVGADPLALALLKSPGELGADIAVGSMQRFGVPMGYGGPHAAYFATRDEHKRLIPGRLIGVSIDAEGRSALRLSLQTREQHIRREKATSNICTAQALLATMASMYAVYHGPEGIRAIAEQVHQNTGILAELIRASGLKLHAAAFFDTVAISGTPQQITAIKQRAASKKINLRTLSGEQIAVSLDETVSKADLADLIEVFTGKRQETSSAPHEGVVPTALRRATPPFTHEIFKRYHTETEFLRYVRRLESRDLSLGTAMIPLGSCTMKLNATTEMVALSWPEFSSLHPFVPTEQAKGYQQLFHELEQALCDVTGFDAVSLQPNSGSQGEYAGLLAIRGYHRSRNDAGRTVCLIPKSAHGTNPASAVMAGFEVVVVECDSSGNVDIEDLRKKAAEHKERLGALMVTYPSTHGVFEEGIKEVCSIVHAQGGQVYMDGANLNALVGLSRPSELGADVCHINLHKTFCIPHGGGGPGMGPIGVREHLAPFLPGHPVVTTGRELTGPVSAAPWGSASILTISWLYMALMGSEGLRNATEVAILNANYLSKRIEESFPTLYRSPSGLVAHECILDLREVKKSAGIEVDDVAKRLMDYGFHPPTVSWPVAGTLMVEPTESESKAELDRFADALIAIRAEIRSVEDGTYPRDNNPLKHAPHTAAGVVAEGWNRPYPRALGAFPSAATRSYKFWPATARIDSTYGDRNLVCTCPPLDSYEK
jgi:glycine dehydrogenase